MDLKIFGNEEMDNEEYFKNCCDSLWEEELNKEVERLKKGYQLFLASTNDGKLPEIPDRDSEALTHYAAITLAEVELPMCRKRDGSYFTPTLEMCKQRWINLKILNK